jgi:hypothetical protein
MFSWLRISLFEEKGWSSQLQKRKLDVVRGVTDGMQKTNILASETYHQI